MKSATGQCFQLSLFGESHGPAIGVVIQGLPPGLELDEKFFRKGRKEELSAGQIRDILGTPDDDSFNILLAHRPELIETYAAYGADLVLSGHAHGGQVRLPFIGALYAPGQGLLPEYDSGLYTVGETDMIVSRGLGNSLIPLRVNNRPELVIAVLHR